MQHGLLKLNVDVAIRKSLGAIGIRAVFCDEKGVVLGILSRRTHVLLDLLKAKLFAMREALAWFKEVGTHSFVLECDCLML